MTVGWGVAGCGWVARDHALPALAATPGARVVALHDRDPGAMARTPVDAPAHADLGEPLPPLRPNPLYADGELRWPSERYAGEYGPRSAYLPARWPDPLPADAARRRLLVDLPEQW